MNWVEALVSTIPEALINEFMPAVRIASRAVRAQDSFYRLTGDKVGIVCQAGVQRLLDRSGQRRRRCHIQPGRRRQLAVIAVSERIKLSVPDARCKQNCQGEQTYFEHFHAIEDFHSLHFSFISPFR